MKLTSWKRILSVGSLVDAIIGVDLDVDEFFKHFEMFKTSFLLRTFTTLSFTTLKPLNEFDLPKTMN